VPNLAPFFCLEGTYNLPLKVAEGHFSPNFAKGSNWQVWKTIYKTSVVLLAGLYYD